jgi:ribosome-binding protein aMBF1 (putative translation factor)
VSEDTYSEAVLGTLTAAERAALAAWLRAQGVAPHRRGMAPRNWVPVTPPKRSWRLAQPLAPGTRPVYLLPPVPGVSRPGDPPGEAYPTTEAQAAYYARLRRERAARAARGEPEPETRHHRHHRRLQEAAAAREAAQRLGAALRAWREGQGLSQTELAHRLGMPRSNVARLEAGGQFPGIPVLQRLAHVLGGAVQLDVRPDGVRVRLGATEEAA